MRSRYWSAVLLLALLAASSGTAGAQIPQSSFTVELQEVATGLSAPILVTHANDGSGRLFIVEQKGLILVIENGNLLPTPFLDISAKLPALGGFFDERGLLGLAFHPDYANNGRFFVRYSAPRAGDPSEPCNDPDAFIPGCHTEVLAEYAVSGSDPNLADPNSEIILYTADQPQFNHNSGEVAFGPKGLLYFTLGDGGGAHDGLADVPPSHGPTGHGQNIETPLGAMLRIDVDGPPDPGLPYAIPKGNPFVGAPGVDEIYLYGLRNAYRFSFDDGPNGDNSMYLPDVGQGLIEEINIGELGGNYGWVIKEGTLCFDPFNPENPPANCANTGPLGEPLIDPVVEYTHAEGGLSIVGGYMYRGSLNPSIRGRYVFGDFSADFFIPSGRLYHLVDVASGIFQIRELMIGVTNRSYDLFLKGFGEDADGEIYVCGSSELGPFGTAGVVHRLIVLSPIPAVVADLSGSERGSGLELSWEIEHADRADAVQLLRFSQNENARVVAEWEGNSAIRHSWIDREAELGRQYTYQVSVEIEGNRVLSNEVALTRTLTAPQRSYIVGNVPNPFNPATEIRFELARGGDALLRIFDASGRSVRTFALEDLTAGPHSFVWNGQDDAGRGVASGVYTLTLEAGGTSDAQRMTLVR